LSVATVLAALLAGTAPATATPPDTPPANERTARLRDGTLLRGEVVEEVPDDHVVIKLPTGEVRRIAWGDLVELTGGASAPALPRPVGPRITIQTNEPNVGLYGLRPELTTWANRWGVLRSGYALGLERVCTAPCGQEVAPGDYFIGGNGIRSSATFTLPPGAPMQLDVTARAWAGPAGAGAALTSVGAVAAAVGAALLIVGAKKDVAPLGNPWFTNEAGRPFSIAGAVVLGSGVALLIPGIVLLAHYRTTVAIDAREIVLKVPGSRIALGARGLRF
jgi:hypothetical protein